MHEGYDDRSRRATAEGRKGRSAIDRHLAGEDDLGQCPSGHGFGGVLHQCAPGFGRMVET